MKIRPENKLMRKFFITLFFFSFLPNDSRYIVVTSSSSSKLHGLEILVNLASIKWQYKWVLFSNECFFLYLLNQSHYHQYIYSILHPPETSLKLATVATLEQFRAGPLPVKPHLQYFYVKRFTSSYPFTSMALYISQCSRQSPAQLHGRRRITYIGKLTKAVYRKRDQRSAIMEKEQHVSSPSNLKQPLWQLTVFNIKFTEMIYISNKAKPPNPLKHWRIAHTLYTSWH